MKPMEYKGERNSEILYEGEYNGFNFRILSLGTHPCAYVNLPKDHIYFKRNYEHMDIDCHCGLTFSEIGICETIPDKKNEWWIGWDYAHAGDYYGNIPEFTKLRNLLCEEKKSTNKKWTTEEIYGEVKNVIEQLIEVKNEKIQNTN